MSCQDHDRLHYRISSSAPILEPSEGNVSETQGKAREPPTNETGSRCTYPAYGNPLTERERAVLAAATLGASIAEIAASLFLSEGTVRNYLSVAMQKLGTHNRVEAAHIAVEKGWL